VPGIPLMAIGRNKKVSWGITAALNDISDLWQETISDDGKTYLLDG
jgi:acyl-homoserine lactone acylase PvdQ